MPKISVIVPVYNSEKYLYRCIDSLLAQSFKDFELILIDDGSTDNSGRICDDYSTLDNRAIVYHKANGGVSSARQMGLEKSQGEFIIFADPDDWVDSNMLMSMLSNIGEETDVLICDYYIASSPKREYLRKQRPAFLKSDSILRQLITGKLHGSTCNKLYRRKTLLKYNISFPEGVNYCEDLWFNCDFFMHDKLLNIKYIDKAFYHYDNYSNASSLSRVFTTDTVKDYQLFVNYILKNTNEDQYKSEHLYLKRVLMKVAFRSNCPSSIYYSLCPNELGSIYNFVYKEKMNYTYKIAEIIAIKGNLALGRLIIRLYEKLYLPMSMTVHKILKLE